MRWLTILAALALAGIASAQDPAASAPAPKSEADLKAKIQAIRKECDDAQNAYFAAYEKALPKDASDEERGKYFDEHPMPDPKNWFGRIWALIDAQPADPGALDGLTWIVAMDHGGDGGEKKKALDLVLKHHFASPEVASICQNLQYDASAEAGAFLEAVLAKGSTPEARGAACFGLAKHFQNLCGMASYYSESATPEQLQKVEKFVGKAELDRLKKVDRAATAARAEKLYERALAEFGDVKLFNHTIGDLAKSELHELRDLAIGKVAPEIVGEDLDGKPMKLSDFRGKVLVLDFWGDW